MKTIILLLLLSTCSLYADSYIEVGLNAENEALQALINHEVVISQLTIKIAYTVYTNDFIDYNSELEWGLNLKVNDFIEVVFSDKVPYNLNLNTFLLTDIDSERLIAVRFKY